MGNLEACTLLTPAAHSRLPLHQWAAWALWFSFWTVPVSTFSFPAFSFFHTSPANPTRGSVQWSEFWPQYTRWTNCSSADLRHHYRVIGSNVSCKFLTAGRKNATKGPQSAPSHFSQWPYRHSLSHKLSKWWWPWHLLHSEIKARISLAPPSPTPQASRHRYKLCLPASSPVPVTSTGWRWPSFLSSFGPRSALVSNLACVYRL